MTTPREWFPIETAPKDPFATVILAGKWKSGKWEVRVGSFCVTRWPFVGGGQPTHWMPLPAAPDSSTVEPAADEGRELLRKCKHHIYQSDFGGAKLLAGITAYLDKGEEE